MAVNLIAVPKLPSAHETANLLANHVFHLHGLPVDIVSDGSPVYLSGMVKLFAGHWEQLSAYPPVSIPKLMDKQ